MIFEIRYCNLSLSIWYIRYYSEDAKDGNPYNTTFKVKSHISRKIFDHLNAFHPPCNLLK